MASLVLGGGCDEDILPAKRDMSVPIQDMMALPSDIRIELPEFDSFVGRLVWDGFVSARGPDEMGTITIKVAPGKYFLVTDGVFSYSTDGGQQDGLRRWQHGYPPGGGFRGLPTPYCMSCGTIKELENLFGFQVNEVAIRPLREELFGHRQLRLIEVGKSGEVTFQINDAYISFGDNSGGLNLSLYEVPPNHPLIERDSDGKRLDMFVGARIPDGGWVGPDLEGYAQPQSVTWSLPDAGAAVFLEITGFSTERSGVERDQLNRFDYTSNARRPEKAEPWIELTCDGKPHDGGTQSAAEDVAAHRYLFRVEGCKRVLTASQGKDKEAAPGVFVMDVYGQK